MLKVNFNLKEVKKIPCKKRVKEFVHKAHRMTWLAIKLLAKERN